MTEAKKLTVADIVAAKDALMAGMKDAPDNVVVLCFDVNGRLVPSEFGRLLVETFFPPEEK